MPLQLRYVPLAALLAVWLVAWNAGSAYPAAKQRRPAPHPKGAAAPQAQAEPLPPSDPPTQDLPQPGPGGRTDAAGGQAVAQSAGLPAAAGLDRVQGLGAGPAAMSNATDMSTVNEGCASHNVNSVLWNFEEFQVCFVAGAAAQSLTRP